VDPGGNSWVWVPVLFHFFYLLVWLGNLHEATGKGPPIPCSAEKERPIHDFSCPERAISRPMLELDPARVQERIDAAREYYWH
jgi:hypothetical protein